MDGGGVFFIVLTTAEVLVACLLLGRRRRRGLLLGAAAISVTPLVAWLWSRTVGLPFGPEPGVAEAVGVPDVLACALEVVALLAVLGLLHAPAGPAPTVSAHQRPRGPGPDRRHRDRVRRRRAQLVRRVRRLRRPFDDGDVQIRRQVVRSYRCTKRPGSGRARRGTIMMHTRWSRMTRRAIWAVVLAFCATLLPASAMAAQPAPPTTARRSRGRRRPWPSPRHDGRTRIRGFDDHTATVRVGRTVVDDVVVVPRARRTILVQARKPGSTHFVTQSQGHSTANGRFRAVYVPTSAGSWRFRLFVLRSATRGRSSPARGSSRPST